MNPNSQAVSTRIAFAETQDQKEAVYRFRYQVYVNELGKHPSEVDHVGRRLVDALDASASQLFAEAVGEDGQREIIATLRLNHAQDAAEHWHDIYGLERFAEIGLEYVSLSSRLMVASGWRGSSALGGMLLAAYQWAREEGKRLDFCHCAPALVEFYEQLGYRRYRPGFEDPDTGFHFPLVLLSGDLDHLRAVRSPFQRPARHWPADATISAWFQGQFPELVSIANRRLMGADAFWQVLQEKLQEPVSEVPLLQGLDEEERRRFLDAGAIVRCSKGDHLIREGDVGHEMFVVLSGVAEVLGELSPEHGHAHYSLAVLGPGQVFGEIAYLSETPRTANVIAQTEMELLVLTQQFMQKAMVRMPEIASKVLFNLSLVLCGRLRDSTQQWLEHVNPDEGSEVSS